MIESPKPSFTDPYDGIDEAAKTRLALWTSSEDHNFLFRTLHPGHGSVTTTVNMLLAKLCKGLKDAKITDHTTQRADFEKFLIECVVTVPKAKKSKNEGV